MDGESRDWLEQIGHLHGAIHGQSVRGNFGVCNAFANMPDSLHTPSVGRDCPS